MVKHVILWKLTDEVVDVANAKVRPFTQTRLCLDYEA